MAFTIRDFAHRAPSVPSLPEPLQLRLGRPGPDALMLDVGETLPLLMTGTDRGGHRTLRWLLSDWVQSLASTNQVDVLAWSEMDVFLDSAGRPGISLTPSLGAWLRALLQARSAGVPQPTVFIGYELTGIAGDEVLAANAGQALDGPDWHVIWATSPDLAHGRLSAELPWRSRLDVEPDARHVVLSRPGRQPERLLAAFDQN